MPDDIVTARSIIQWFETQVEAKQPIPPGTFVDAAAKLNVLLGDEDDRLAEMEMVVAKLKVDYIVTQKGKPSIAMADAQVHASPEFRDMRRQEMFRERIVEFIRLGKLRARMTMDEMRSV